MIFKQNLREQVQATIPPLEPKSALKAPRITQELTKFDPSKISPQDYKDFITFVEGILSTTTQYHGLVPSRFSLESALEILHQSNYSVSRAKFWIQFPILYKYEHEVDQETAKLSKRQRLADLPDEDLYQYFEEYYEGLRKNKSNAERLWMANVARFLSQEVKSGREARKLYNEGIFSKFESHYDLKCLYDLENKLSHEIDTLLSQNEKDTSEISKLFRKCSDQSFHPSNFDRLEEAFNTIQALNEEIKESLDKCIHFNDLKQLHDRVNGYRKTTEYKAVVDRYNNACKLKSAINIFWKNQSCKTRGSAEERFDISKGMEILKQSEQIKVELENTDKFRERITSIYKLLSEIESFLNGSDDEKTLRLVIDYSNRLSEYGIETPLVLKLNRLRDALQIIEEVEKRVTSLADAETNLEHLRRISEEGFKSKQLMRLVEILADLIQWKGLYRKFSTPPEPFNLVRMIKGDYYFAIRKELDMFLSPKHVIQITDEIRHVMMKAKEDFMTMKFRVQEIKIGDDVLHKLELAKFICSNKMIDEEIKTFLYSVTKEATFYHEVLCLMGTIQGWQYQDLSLEKRQELERFYLSSSAAAIPKPQTWFRFADHIKALSELLLNVTEPQPTPNLSYGSCTK